MQDIIDINAFKTIIREFVNERDWDQYQNPKNLAMALTVEAAELLEIFQWLSPEEAQNAKHHPETKTKISHEIADIFFYLIRVADKTNINLQNAIIEKMQLNAQKYPVEVVKGSSKKYNEHQ